MSAVTAAAAAHRVIYVPKVSVRTADAALLMHQHKAGPRPVEQDQLIKRLS